MNLDTHLAQGMGFPQKPVTIETRSNFLEGPISHLVAGLDTAGKPVSNRKKYRPADMSRFHSLDGNAYLSSDRYSTGGNVINVPRLAVPNELYSRRTRVAEFCNEPEVAKKLGAIYEHGATARTEAVANKQTDELSTTDAR